MLSFYDWYADLPVASPAGLRRPDRRARVRRLVGRRLPDHVGLQPAGHPHPRRALDDRGALPRPEGHRGRARLRRQRQVRRRVAGRPPGHRRRAGDGDGPRRPQGVLRRPADAVLHRLRQAATPTCRSWSASTAAPAGRHGYVPGKFLTAADLDGEQAASENAAFKTVLLDAGTGEPVVPNGSLGHRFGDEGVGPVEPRPRRRRPVPAARRRRRRRSPVRAPAPLRRPPTAPQRCSARRAGPPGRRPPGHHRLRPAAGAVRRRPGRAARRRGPPGTTTPTRRTPPPGRRRSPASRRQAAARIGREFAAERRGVARAAR